MWRLPFGTLSQPSGDGCGLFGASSNIFDLSFGLPPCLEAEKYGWKRMGRVLCFFFKIRGNILIWIRFQWNFPLHWAFLKIEGISWEVIKPSWKPADSFRDPLHHPPWLKKRSMGGALPNLSRKKLILTQQAKSPP